MADAGSAGAEGKEEAEPAVSSPAPEGGPGRERVLDFIADSFLRTLEPGMFPMFAKCFRRLYKAQPRVTKCVYDQFLVQLQSSVKEEIQELKEEGNLAVLFETLDKLEKGAKGRESPAWRPSGVPGTDLRVAVGPPFAKQRLFLQASLKEAEARSALLAREVMEGRKAIEELQEGIWRHRDQWQAIAADCRRTLTALEAVP